MNSREPSYGTWHRNEESESAMEDGHRPIWHHFIRTIPETDLSTYDVLDFGCNRGGFLRLLHGLKPFRRALGVDIAYRSIAAARSLVGSAPIDYEVGSDLSAWPGRFDLAFSYEVVYLLPDIAAHASSILAALRPGGVYYAVTGCHTDSPLWPGFRKVISETTSAPIHDRSPDDYAAAFAAAGFAVSVRRFGYSYFVPAPRDPRYYPKLMDAVDYVTAHKLLFRFAKPD